MRKNRAARHLILVTISQVYCSLQNRGLSIGEDQRTDSQISAIKKGSVMTEISRHSIPLLVALIIGCGGQSDATQDAAPHGGSVDDAGVSYSCSDFVSPVPDESRNQFEVPPPDLRDYRYCEVLPAFVYGDKICVEVYNTLSFSNCPEQAWVGLDADALKAELGAERLFLNGPRHWVINGAMGNAALTNLKIASFGTLQMGRPGLLELDSVEELPSAIVRYVEHEVKRSNTWIYAAGNEVYELTSAAGDVYIMQSYSRMVDSELNIDVLAGLGRRLMLPDGWTFSSRVLDADYALVADGQAYVIQDDFANTYQRK